MTPGRSAQRARTRARVLEAAAALAAEGGPDAVSIRAVGAATGIQAPTIYRLFGNKQNLLDAVAAEGFASHVRSHPDLHPHEDPVDDLRWGWDAHVAYALSHPHEYRMTFALPHPGSPHPAAVHAQEILAGRIRRVADAGRLRVTGRRAMLLFQAGAAGTALTLLASSEEDRDAGLSAAAREAVVAAITTDGTHTTVAGRGPASEPHPSTSEDDPSLPAGHLLALLDRTSALTAGERTLLAEWLERIVSGRHTGLEDGRPAERATDPPG